MRLSLYAYPATKIYSRFYVNNRERLIIASSLLIRSFSNGQFGKNETKRYDH